MTEHAVVIAVEARRGRCWQAGWRWRASFSISVIPHAFAEVSSGVATATVLGFITGYLLN